MPSNRLKTVQNIDLKISGLKILSKIGEGGMSVVYLAEQVSLKREVAVKVMRLEVAENDLDVQRFKHEAKTIARLDHPNIINIYNIGLTSKGEVFYTMPYLNHGDFSNYIIEDEQEFILLLQSICDGLSFAHDRDVIHRDIKPENLLFDKFGNVRIADFGIAISKEGSRMTKEHQIVGSAQYMSPEQARSLTVDVQSDIYSMGIVIYERLTGSVPFDSDESISILVNHVSKEPDKLPVKMRHWQKLIDKCLAKSPEDRYQTMVELKIALSKIPINSLQRTNDSIQNILADEKGRHLKWFIPGLVVLFVIALISFKSAKNKITPIDNQTNNTAAILANTENIGPSTTIQTDEKVLIEGGDNATTVDVSFDNLSESTKELSINEIRQKLGQQTGTKILTDDDMAMEMLNQEVNLLLLSANENIKKYQLSKPAGNNATDQLLKILSLSPDNQEAIKGIESIGLKYVQLIEKAVKAKDYNLGLKYSRSLNIFNQKSQLKNKNFEAQKMAVIKVVAELDISATITTSEQVMTLVRIVKIFSPQDQLIQQLKVKTTLKTGPQIGDKLLDEMGVETILISNKLAVSLHEITVEHYAEFAQATSRVEAKCKHKGGGVNNFFSSKYWNKPYFPQDQDHPVVCVSQADAVAYSKWLSSQTENNYRLPTRQEWLILAANDSNTFKPCMTANVSGQEAEKIRNKEEKYICTDSYKFTAPVATFDVNKIGLFDVQGNVSEWVSCDSLPCKNPMVMGSSWFHGKQTNKLDISETLKPDVSYSYVGFRLVRDL